MDNQDKTCTKATFYSFTVFFTHIIYKNNLRKIPQVIFAVFAILMLLFL